MYVCTVYLAGYLSVTDYRNKRNKTEKKEKKKYISKVCWPILIKFHGKHHQVGGKVA